MFYVFPLQGISRRETCSKKNGFSLIEILAVVAIIIVFSSVVTANFSEARGQLALKRAAHQMIQDIRRAQEMAMSSAEFKESENCSPPLPVAKGYGIFINLESGPDPGDNKNYILYADKNGDENYSSADCIIKTISIEEKGIVIKEIQNTSGQNVTINFKPPNPNTSIKWLNEIKNEVEIVLALEANQLKTKTVVVNRAGMLQTR